jgi:hypothetical protein
MRNLTDEQVSQLADSLNGTCDGLDGILEELFPGAELDDGDALELDLSVFLCETCGWWCDQSESAAQTESGWICDNCD